MPEPERFHEAVKRAQLTDPEVELLKQLGPAAGRSPRAVKRLLNLYRLFRATRAGQRLNAFLNGDPSTEWWPDYPGAQLCLAVQAGLSAEQIHCFREAVIFAAAGDGITPRQALDLETGPNLPEGSWRASMDKFFQNLSVEQHPDEVRGLFRIIVDRFGDTSGRLQALRDIVVETSRFSFSPLSDHQPVSTGETAAKIEEG